MESTQAFRTGCQYPRQCLSCYAKHLALMQFSVVSFGPILQMGKQAHRGGLLGNGSQYASFGSSVPKPGGNILASFPNYFHM